MRKLVNSLKDNILVWFDLWCLTPHDQIVIKKYTTKIQFLWKIHVKGGLETESSQLLTLVEKLNTL
jgi:hypothetical protein